MHIEITPTQFLEFENTPDQISTTFLRLRNIHRSALCFKVKTTAPKCYVVKPSLGFLEIGESREITVTMSHKGESQDILKHKFSIQTAPTALNSPNIDQITSFWNSSPDEVRDERLSVKLVDPTLTKSFSVYGSVTSERSDSVRSEVKDLKEFQEKQEDMKDRLEKELRGILEQLKSRDEEINKVEEEALKGFGNVHLVLACLLGILVGYIYAIIKA